MTDSMVILLKTQFNYPWNQDSNGLLPLIFQKALQPTFHMQIRYTALSLNCIYLFPSICEVVPLSLPPSFPSCLPFFPLLPVWGWNLGPWDKESQTLLTEPARRPLVVMFLSTMTIVYYFLSLISSSTMLGT